MVANEATEFGAFRKLAMSIIIKVIPKPVDNNYYFDNSEVADVLALYMLGKISRYGVAMYYENQYYWGRIMNELHLVELFEEADKYNPTYKAKTNV